MKLFKVLRYDIQRNKFNFIKYLILTCVVFSFFYLLFVFDSFHQFAYFLTGPDKINELNLSIGDGILFELGGSLPLPDNSQKRGISFPTSFFLCNILILYFTLNYLNDDINHGGIQIFTRLGSMKTWWHSKCILTIITVIIYYILGFTVFVFLCFISNKVMSLQPNTDVFSVRFHAIYRPVPDWKLFIAFFIQPAVVMLCLSILQMTLSLFVKPVYAFTAISIYIMLGVFFVSPVFISNYAMPLRSAAIGIYNFDFFSGFLICMVIIIMSSDIGQKRASCMDILGMR